MVVDVLEIGALWFKTPEMRPESVYAPGVTDEYSPLPLAVAPYFVPTVSLPLPTHTVSVDGGLPSAALLQPAYEPAVSFCSLAQKFTLGSLTPKLKNFTAAPAIGAEIFCAAFFSPHAASTAAPKSSASDRRDLMSRFMVERSTAGPCDSPRRVPQLAADPPGSTRTPSCTADGCDRLACRRCQGRGSSEW